MDDALVDGISHKLDIIIKLLALSMGEGKTQNELIRLLAVVGLPPRVIAEILGTTGNTVRVALTRIRRQSRNAHTRLAPVKPTQNLPSGLTRE